jgi:hypothetical protein
VIEAVKEQMPQDADLLATLFHKHRQKAKILLPRKDQAEIEF